MSDKQGLFIYLVSYLFIFDGGILTKDPGFNNIRWNLNFQAYGAVTKRKKIKLTWDRSESEMSGGNQLAIYKGGGSRILDTGLRTIEDKF